jgi:hypothetical protein
MPNRTAVDLCVIAHNIDHSINEDTSEPDHGFALLVFDYRAGGADEVGFITNAQKDTVVVLMKQFIARLEGRFVVEPGHA